MVLKNNAAVHAEAVKLASRHTMREESSSRLCAASAARKSCRAIALICCPIRATSATSPLNQRTIDAPPAPPCAERHGTPTGEPTTPIQQQMKTLTNALIGRTLARNLSLRILNDMTEDDSVINAINAIPRQQRNRRIRKFASLASKRGISAAVLADFIAAIK